MKKQRLSERYDDFARIECPEICIVSGSLTDISESGFKAEFNAPCEVDTEREYMVLLRLSRISTEPLELTVQPVWQKVTDGKTSIGFSILHSKDSVRLDQYIKMRKDDKSSADSNGIITFDTESLFI
ncbi:MAG: hypothetical protein IJ158_10960 [Treponema sp.]|nr:hypothetical protein [Treponema sp.]